MVNPQWMKVVEACFLAQPSDAIHHSIDYVFEQVSTIKWNHRNQVCESKQDVNPNQPEEQID